MSKAEQLPVVTIPEIKTLLLNVYFPTKQPVFLWGAPGIGKSDLVADLGFETNRPVLDIRLAQYDPTDVRGIPYFDGESRQMKWAKPSEFPAVVNQDVVETQRARLTAQKEVVAGLLAQLAVVRADLETTTDSAVRSQLMSTISALSQQLTTAQDRADDMNNSYETAKIALKFQNAILFLDELVSAPQSVQAAAYQLILNRKIGEYHLPEGVDIIAAGNRDTDRGVTFTMPSPLANRFSHFELTINSEQWLEWATNNNVHPLIVGFLTANKDMLFKFDPKTGNKAFATPRSWTKGSNGLNQLDDLVATGKTDDKGRQRDMLHVIASNVGQGVAQTFKIHSQTVGKLPNPADILDGKPNLTFGTKEPSALVSLLTSLCYTFRDRVQSMDQALTTVQQKQLHEKWGDNMYQFGLDYLNDRPELAVMLMRMSLKQFKLPIGPKTKGYNEMYAKHGKLIN